MFDTRLLVLALGLAAALITGQASADCDRGWLDIRHERDSNLVTLTAINNSDVPITFTAKLRLLQMRTSSNSPITDSLHPRESKVIATLEPTSDSHPGNFEIDKFCTVGNKDADHDDDMVYLLPYESGESYRVLQGYGSRFSHTGRETYAVDFYMKEGTPVHAARDGVVAQIEESHNRGCWEDGCGRYANYIVVLHDDETTGEYYHLLQDGALVDVGDRISAGQLIALSGNTGHSTMPHLHFGVYRAVRYGREQSIPVRYLTSDGILNKPRSGGRYLAVKSKDLKQADAGGDTAKQTTLQ